MSKRKKITTVFVALLMFFTLITVSVDANTEVIIEVGGTQLDVLIDPVTYERDKAVFEDVEGKIVLYTPNWHYQTTNNTFDVNEYVAVINSSGKYTITEVLTSGNQFIPLNGVVLSIPKSSTNNFNVNDIIDVKENNVETYEHAIVSEKNIRIAFNRVNESTSNNTITYYNRMHSSQTTGSFTSNGNEMIVRFDKQLNSFVVDKIDAGGNNTIPKDGFIISATGRPRQYMLDEGVMFNDGDKIELVNLDFLEFEETFTKPYTAINGTRQSEYLVIYPAAINPSLSSNQNVHGFEVAVDENGTVVEKGVLVNIPEGGFVLSGHGAQHTFLNDEIELGAKITYDTTTKLITVYNNILDQTVFSSKINQEIANEQVKTADEGMYDVNDLEKAQTVLALINEYADTLEDLNNKINSTNKIEDIIDFMNHKDLIEPLFEEVYFSTLVSRRIETRGIWHRPFEFSLREIEETLDELKSMNFTDVYLETFWNGYVVYKSDYAPYHIIFDGANFGNYEDYLDAFITEAKKRNINVHAWVENFFVGVSWQHSDLWNEHPEWRIEDINGNQAITGKPGGDEEGFLFFDPANPGAREFVLNIYKEIIEYDIVGLQLDYIRYPSGNTEIQYSTGYTEYAMNEFKTLNGITGDLKQLVKTNSEIYGKWNQYRQNVINTFVEEIHNNIRPLKEELMLSIAVGPDAAYATVNLMQDWRKWVNNGWIDAVKPMAYVNDVNTLTDIIVASKVITGDMSYNFTGISPTYDGLPDIYNAHYTDAINKNGPQGSAIFATHNLRKKENLIKVFQNGTYNKQSISANHPINEIFDVFVVDIISKFENIYVPKGAATNAQKEAISTRLTNLQEKDYYNPSHFQTLYENLDTLILELELYANGAARERLTEDIEYLMEILNIRISRYLINNGYWNPIDTEERPDVNDFEYPIIEVEKPAEESKGSKTLLYVIIGFVSIAVIGVGTTLIIKRYKK